MPLKENQTIEYKVIWKDEYLKNICAFANSQGGKLYIGLNDQGNITGIKHNTKLLEDIPNKTNRIRGYDTINDRQRLIITILAADPDITITELAQKMSVGIATIKRDAEFLKEIKVLKRMGSRKSGHWHINIDSK